jgi:hypothetical protein
MSDICRTEIQKWWIMSKRKSKREMDDMTKLLLSQGVYSLKNSDDAMDKKVLKMLKSSEKRIYRFWLGVFYGMILMISLYWLPLFGPMIAGYVAGRRAGSPTKGTIAGALIVATFYILQRPSSLSALPFDLVSARDALFSSISYHASWMIPAISFIKSYTAPTITVLSGQLTYTPQTYTILLVFAYIGGTLAKQRREEIRLMAMSRIASHLPVYPVTMPSPHHSAIPVAGNGVRFEDMERASYVPDREIKRIYDEEYEPEPVKRKSRGKRPKKEELARSLVKDHRKNRIEVL